MPWRSEQLPRHTQIEPRRQDREPLLLEEDPIMMITNYQIKSILDYMSISLPFWTLKNSVWIQYAILCQTALYILGPVIVWILACRASKIILSILISYVFFWDFAWGSIGQFSQMILAEACVAQKGALHRSDGGSDGGSECSPRLQDERMRAVALRHLGRIPTLRECAEGLMDELRKASGQTEETKPNCKRKHKQVGQEEIHPLCWSSPECLFPYTFSALMSSLLNKNAIPSSSSSSWITMGFHVKEWIASIATHDCASRSHFKELGRVGWGGWVESIHCPLNQVTRIMRFWRPFKSSGGRQASLEVVWLPCFDVASCRLFSKQRLIERQMCFFRNEMRFLGTTQQRSWTSSPTKMNLTRRARKTLNLVRRSSGFCRKLMTPMPAQGMPGYNSVPPRHRAAEPRLRMPAMYRQYLMTSPNSLIAGPSWGYWSH